MFFVNNNKTAIIQQHVFSLAKQFIECSPDAHSNARVSTPKQWTAKRGHVCTGFNRIQFDEDINTNGEKCSPVTYAIRTLIWACSVRMRQHTTNIELLFYEIENSFLFNELVNSESQLKFVLLKRNTWNHLHVLTELIWNLHSIPFIEWIMLQTHYKVVNDTLKSLYVFFINTEKYPSNYFFACHFHKPDHPSP